MLEKTGFSLLILFFPVGLNSVKSYSVLYCSSLKLSQHILSQMLALGFDR